MLIISYLSACSSTGIIKSTDTSGISKEKNIDISEERGITARGAIGERLEPGAFYSGDGGINIRLAIIAPSIYGEVPEYLPIYIQGLLNNNFGKYSAINLIDRQNLDMIISEQNIAQSGAFSDDDLLSIGNITNTQYFLFGTIQRLSGNRFALQLSITDSSTGIRLASSIKEGTLSQLEGNGILVNESTEELLTQMGIQLTESGRQTLLAGNISVVRAETGLARGITAQAGGDELAALFSYTQAVAFDPSRMESLSRLTTLSSAISGGTISERILNDIQARNRWIEVFKETTKFFNEHPPFEILFDPNLIQIGETDYIRSTANLGMRIIVQPSQAGFKALNTLLEGLYKTGRRDTWGFSGWPLIDTSQETANSNPSVRAVTEGTIVFGGKRSFNYDIDIELINENNKIIGSSRVSMTINLRDFSVRSTVISLPGNNFKLVDFRNINANDLTHTLTIAITAVNGIPSNVINTTGYMRIDTGDLEIFHIGAQELERQNQIKKEQEAAAQKQKAIEAAIQRQERHKANSKKIFYILGGLLLLGGVAAYSLYSIYYSN